MHIQPIGKHLLRTVVKSERARAKLARIPGIIIDGDRVIFPEELEKTVRKANKTRAEIQAAQTELFT